MAKPFSDLRERLLRAGVAPRHVRRYLSELDDHISDLKAEEKNSGHSSADAEAAALIRLGSMDYLAAAMIQKRQFQAWSARAPWAMFSVAPLLLLAVAYYVSLFLLWSGWQIFLPNNVTPFVRLEGFAIFYLGIGRLIYFGAPIFVSWSILVIAARQRFNALWPAVSTVLIAFVAAAVQLHVSRTTVPGGLGHVRIGFGFPGSDLLLFGRLVYAAVILSLAWVPYVVWRLRRDYFNRTALAIALMTALSLASPVQSHAQKLEFDVASIRSNKSSDRPTTNFPIGPGDVYAPNGGLFHATNQTLTAYILFAYKITGNQIPALTRRLQGWATTDKFDIQARTDRHDATKDEMRLMMRSLLIDRFKLAIHTETQQVPVLGMVLAKPGKTGQKLQPHPIGAVCSSSESDQKRSVSTVVNGLPMICGGVVSMPPSTAGRRSVGARNVSMALIAASLNAVVNLGRPILDQTGLKGTYDFVLEFVPELPTGMNAAGPQSDASGPTFLEALTEQLGLKLISQNGPLTVWVVDHVEHPSEN